eukprot:CAMPEP_0115023902 /NCGR_PEP_ID=MMETSP0216-20121206/32760_1 /TAXON_ID=223996 /ORGANISM="Protocruzia adherens, Strain Boccale" /LENGTH=48 /DNA_ID= /DNA_START= /DNA_END= /DNA_ORIENTATION=
MSEDAVDTGRAFHLTASDARRRGRFFAPSRLKNNSEDAYTFSQVAPIS